MIFAASLGSVLIGNILLELYNIADLSSQEGLLSYIVSGAYPIVDMFLLVPAVAALLQLRNGWMTFIPWVFIVTGIIHYSRYWLCILCLLENVGRLNLDMGSTIQYSIWRIYLFTLLA